MNDRKLLVTGIAGTVYAAVCCFTPVLVVLLGAVGLSAATGYLDYVLPPALLIFVTLTAYALWRRKQRPLTGGVHAEPDPRHFGG